MSRRKQRSAFDQVFEFDSGRIMAYREIVDYISVTHLSEIPRWSDSSLKTPWRADAEQMRYAPPPALGIMVESVLDITIALL
ncbi:hypothetical protein TNCV_4850501 [Trichonephila clavipes]|nr:hypothetical protein TNCV_4850501 [Trichonephila clavipes]